jgi:hypothetical protein
MLSARRHHANARISAARGPHSCIIRFIHVFMLLLTPNPAIFVLTQELDGRFFFIIFLIFVLTQELDGRAITCNNARQMVERPEGEEAVEAPRKAPGLSLSLFPLILDYNVYFLLLHI